jgi:hypothetical protein
VSRRAQKIVGVAGALAFLVAGGAAFAFVDLSAPAAAALGSLMSLAILVIFLIIDVESLVAHLSDFRPIIPVLVFSGVSLSMSNTAGNVQFDEIGAQIIVVLLLALAVDARFFRVRRDTDGYDMAAIFFAMAILAVGEYFALSGVLNDDPRHAEMIAAAIAAGFAAVAVSSLGSGNRDDEEQG